MVNTCNIDNVLRVIIILYLDFESNSNSIGLLQILFVMHSIDRRVRSHIKRFNVLETPKGIHLMRILSHIEKEEFKEARKITLVNLMELNLSSLQNGDLFNSEEKFLESIHFLVEFEQTYMCPNNCHLSRTVVASPMDLSIRSPNLFALMLTTEKESGCDNCSNPDRREDGPMAKTTFSWSDSGPPPFLCYAVAYGGNDYPPTEFEVPLAEIILGVKYKLFSYTV